MPSDPSHNPIDARFLKIAALQAQRPWIPLLACAGLTVGLGLAAMRLELKTQFDQLLPQNQPSVIELKRVATRMPALSNVFVVLESSDTALLREFADHLVPKLEALGPPWVTSAEDGIQAAIKFLRPRAGLFLSSKELRDLRAEIAARYGRALDKSFGVSLEEEAPKPIGENLEQRFLTPQWQALKRYPDGYYQSRDGHAVVAIARTGVASGDLAASRQALARIRAVVEEARQPRFSAVSVSYAGDLVTGLFEYGAIFDDLMNVGTLGLSLILGVILLFFMRVRALVALAFTIATGLAWTFGATRLAVGHLNVVTGFLVSIIAGNGINFGIIYMARYLEERGTGAGVEQSLAVAHRTTWEATLAAALAAAASYGSLGTTDFLGFKHFAFIGAAGMILCWIATYMMTPAILAVVERIRPIKLAHLLAEGSKLQRFWRRLRAQSSRFDAPFSWLVFRMPRMLTVAGLALALVSGAATLLYVRSKPIEYNMRKLQNDLGQSRQIYRVSALAREVLGTSTESGIILLADRLDQVLPLKHALEMRRDSSPPESRPFQDVHSLFDFVAPDQEKKLADLDSIRSKLASARALDLISDQDWARISPYLPPKGLRPYSLGDLPNDLVRPFTERDGTRGRVLLVEPTANRDDNDLRYLIQWADSVRETQLPDGSVVRGSGRAVILADMLKAVLADMPQAMAMSLGMTVLAVFVMFRRRKLSFAVLAALLLGIAWLGGLIAAFKSRINFFNFIAFPITFGIGVDYAMNVVQRYAEGGDVKTALRKTGGAVVLCSLTTTLGYLALTRSLNQAVRSLGHVAVLGEICCLLAAMLVLPAALHWGSSFLKAMREGRVNFL